MIYWVTTEPNPRSPSTGFDAGQRGWRLHAVEVPKGATFKAIRFEAALCGLRARHGWGMDMFIDGKCKRCQKRADLDQRVHRALVKAGVSAMSIQVARIEHRVLHVHAGTQRELCDAFARVQEFYESPDPAIKGQTGLTREFIYDRFRDVHGVEYNETWHGFNVPGHIVIAFLHGYSEVSQSVAERALFNDIINVAPEGRFYVIGTHDGYDAFDHELAHASYYLSEGYREASEVLVESFTVNKPDLSIALLNYLTVSGYAQDVFHDEVNAYMATTDEEWWQEHFNGDTARGLWQAGEPFREMFKNRGAL